MSMTSQEYWAEVAAIALACAKEAHEDDRDKYDVLHETVDGHQWIIYNGYHTQILGHTENANAYFDEGLCGLEDKDNTSDVLQLLAFCAFKADIENHSAFGTDFTLEFPDTPTQRYLESMGACEPARKWVADKTLERAWAECEYKDWMVWLVDNVHLIKAAQAGDKAWDEAHRLFGFSYRQQIDFVREQTREQREAVYTLKACETCDQIRATFECPKLPEDV